MAIKGKDFVLEVLQDGQWLPLCYATDCVINQIFEAKEISGPQGQWRDYIGGYSGYNLSAPALTMYIEDMNFVQLEALAHARAKFQWRAGDQLPSGVIHSGTVLITSLNMTSQFRDAVKFDMTAIGCGPKTTILAPFNSTVYLADENKVRLVGCPNPYPAAVYWYTVDGNGLGDFIGIALNSDDVVSLYNAYAENEYYTLSIGTTGCDFNLISDWNAPFIPDVVFAQPTPDLALSSDQNNNMVVSPDQDNDQALSPAYA